MEKVELKKELFKEVFGAMINVKDRELSEDEVLKITCGAINQFSQAYSLKRAVAKKEFSNLGGFTKNRVLPYSTFGMKIRLQDFKNNFLGGNATT